MTIGIYAGGVLLAILLVFCCVLCIEKVRKNRKRITEVVELKPVDIKLHRMRIAQQNKNKNKKRPFKPRPALRPDSPPRAPTAATTPSPIPELKPARMPVPILQQYDDDSDQDDYHSSKGGTRYKSKEVDYNNISASSRPLRNHEQSMSSTQEWQRAAKADISTSQSMHFKKSPFSPGNHQAKSMRSTVVNKPPAPEPSFVLQ